MSILEELAQYAVRKAVQKTKVKNYEMGITDARKQVKVSAVKQKKVAQERTLVLDIKFGRRRLSLSAIGADVLKLQIPDDQLEEVTGMIYKAVDNGDFDSAIIEAQESLKPVKKDEVKPQVVAQEQQGVAKIVIGDSMPLLELDTEYELA